MSPKDSQLIEWFKLNLPIYLEHNEPSAVTKEALKNFDKAIERIEGHVEKIMDKLEDTYSKKELDKKIEKKADKWVQSGLIGCIGTVITLFITKLFNLI